MMAVVRCREIGNRLLTAPRCTSSDLVRIFRNGKLVFIVVPALANSVRRSQSTNLDSEPEVFAGPPSLQRHFLRGLSAIVRCCRRKCEFHAKMCCPRQRYPNLSLDVGGTKPEWSSPKGFTLSDPICATHVLDGSYDQQESPDNSVTPKQGMRVRNSPRLAACSTPFRQGSGDEIQKSQRSRLGGLCSQPVVPSCVTIIARGISIFSSNSVA